MNSKKEQIEREIRHSVWEGKVPLRISFDSSDMGFLPKSPPHLTFDDYYCLLPRCAYFSFFLKDFIGFLFRDVLEDHDFSWSEVWLEYKSLPLKWHYPIGLLYDLFYEQPFENNQTDLSWHITIRYGNYPADKLFRFFQPKQVEPMPSSDFFMALNKESNYIRHGNAKKIMNLSKSDQNQLWESLIAMNFDGFWDVQSRLNDYDVTLDLSESSIKNIGSDNQDQAFNLPRYIPIRIHLIEDSSLSFNELNYPNFFQELVTPLIQSTSNKDIGEKSKEDYELTTLLQAIEAVETIPLVPHLNIIAHGIALPSNTPLIWAYLHFMHPDGFLHLTLKISSDSTS